MAANEGNAGSGDDDGRPRPASGQRRKPQPVTIDLAASSVTYSGTNEPRAETPAAPEDTAAPSAPSDAASNPATSDDSLPSPTPEPATPSSRMGAEEATTAGTTSAAATSDASPEEKIAPQSPIGTDARPDAEPAPASAGTAEPSHAPRPAPEATQPARGVLPNLVAAGILGGAIGLVASYGLASAGLWPVADQSSVTSEIAALKTRLAAAEARVAPTGPLASELNHLKSIPSIPGVTVSDVEKILDPFTARTNAAVAHMDEIDRRIAGEQAVVRGQVKAAQDALTARMATLDAGASANSAGTKQLNDAVAKLREDLAALDKKSADQLASARKDLEASTTALASQVSDLDKRSAADLVIVRGSLNDTNGKVDKLQTALSGLTSDNAELHKAVDGLGGRLAAVDDVKAILAQQTTKLATADDAKKAADGVVASLWIIDQRIANLQAKLTELDTVKTTLGNDGKAIAQLQSRVGPVETRLADIDQFARKGVDARKQAIAAVAVSNLKAAAEAGQPFANELATAKTIAGSTVDLSPLDAYATKGLVPEARIADAFDTVSRRILETAPRPSSGSGVLDALLSHATSAVKIMPANAEAGDSLDARVSRIDARLKAHDLAGALAEWQALPDTARTIKASADWGALLKTRVEGLKAVAAISDQVMTKLTAASE